MSTILENMVTQELYEGKVVFYNHRLKNMRVEIEDGYIVFYSRRTRVTVAPAGEGTHFAAALAKEILENLAPTRKAKALREENFTDDRMNEKPFSFLKDCLWIIENRYNGASRPKVDYEKMKLEVEKVTWFFFRDKENRGYNFPSAPLKLCFDLQHRLNIILR